MSQLKIKVEIMGGTRLEEAQKELIATAKRLGINVSADFNRDYLTAFANGNFLLQAYQPSPNLAEQLKSQAERIGHVEPPCATP